MLGGFFKPGRPWSLDTQEEIKELYYAGYNMKEFNRTVIIKNTSN